MTQKQALDVLKLGYNVYLTGPAGSGKTFLLNQYIDYLKKNNRGVAITASTGIAATHMGGVTIHSWSGMGIKDYLTTDALQGMLDKPYLQKKFKSADVLIIDEISMLHSFQFDMINEICQAFKDNYAPFGGMQIVCSGDFFQLPPVQKHGKQALFATESNIWQNMDLKVCYLTEQFRQENNSLLSLLNHIRSGNAKDARSVLFGRDEDAIVFSANPVKLYTHNIDVDAINNFELGKIQGKTFIYNMHVFGKKNLVTALKKSCLAPERLLLKKGAKVMFVKNNFEKGFVNGTLGIVVNFGENGLPIIKTFSDDYITAYPMSWVIDEEGVAKAQISQLPLRLAWAITVHKSQGMTLDALEVDLSKSFVYGMGYVALSRARSLDNLKLLGINEMAFSVDQNVLELDEQLKQVSQKVVNVLEALTQEEKMAKQKKFLNSLIKTKWSKSSGQLKQLEPKISTYEKTKALIADKLSIKEMAKNRGVTERTIISHLEKLAESQKALDIDYLKLPQERFLKISQAFAQTEDWKLSPAREILGNDFSYQEIQIARLFLQKA